MTVAAILRHKGSEVVSIDATETLVAVVRLLTERRIGAVVVQGPGKPLLGILSERDIVHALAAHGAAALTLSAAAVMTPGPQSVTPITTVEEAMALMTSGRFRHLPVLSEGKLIGLVSIGDVVKARIAKHQADMEGLLAYVSDAG
jgi:CBS domain-containing protein